MKLRTLSATTAVMTIMVSTMPLMASAAAATTQPTTQPTPTQVIETHDHEEASGILLTDSNGNQVVMDCKTGKCNVATGSLMEGWTLGGATPMPTHIVGADPVKVGTMPPFRAGK